MRVPRLLHLYLISFFAIVQSLPSDLGHGHAFLQGSWAGPAEIHSHDCGDVELHKPLPNANHCLLCSRFTVMSEAALILRETPAADHTPLVVAVCIGSYRSSDAELVLFRGPPVYPS